LEYCKKEVFQIFTSLLKPLLDTGLEKTYGKNNKIKKTQNIKWNIKQIEYFIKPGRWNIYPKN